MLAAQAPQFKAGVDLVQIDVVALDKDGHPVRGLTASDFTLSDRSRLQPITTFKEVTISGAEGNPANANAPSSGAAINPEVVSNQDPPADRLVVMVLDDLHVFQGRADRAKAIAHKIATALGPQSMMAILFTSGHHNVDFTRDPDTIAKAIETFAPAPVGRRPGPASDDPRTPFKQCAFCPPPPATEGHNEQLFFDDEALPKTIDDAATLLLSTEARRKAFVLISESTGANLTGMFNGTVYCGSGRTLVPEAGAERCYFHRAIDFAVKAMQQANITLYAFDPRGAVAQTDIPLECTPGLPTRGRDPCVGGLAYPDDNWIRYAQKGLQLTAEATGGFAVTNTDDFDGGINRLRQEIDHYYLLGFSPPDRAGSGFRPVTVTVNRPGITLHYRRGYVMGAADETRSKADPLVAMSASILPRTDLPLRLTATALSPVIRSTKSGPLTRVVAIMEATLPNGQNSVLRYAMLAVNLETGKVVANEANAVDLLRLKTTAAPTATTVCVTVPMDFTLPPGRYQLRASGLSPDLEKGGSVYLQVDVPDLRSGRLILGAPILGSEPTDTLVAHGGSTATLPFIPTLDRAFSETDTLNVLCPLAHRAGAAPTVAVDVLATDGHVVESAQPDTPAADGDPIIGRVPLAALSAGTYSLRVRASDGGESAERKVAITIK